MKQEHPHAELLRAIADGGLEATIEFECRKFSLLLTDPWHEASCYTSYLIFRPTAYDVRRKPRTVMIGNTEVQAGITEAPVEGTLIYTASPAHPEGFWFDSWKSNLATLTGLQRGLIHLTEEPAEAMGRALAGLTEHKDE